MQATGPSTPGVASDIPGAYQLDPYRAQNYLAAALPVCQTAEQIAVYCNIKN